MEKLNIENIANRLSGETPSFFKKIRKIMITMGAVGAAIIAVPVSVVVFPGVVLTAAGYMIACGMIGTALSSLPVKDYPTEK